jgi:NMD protein affecting ribosome stability and mRNA decay
MKSEHDVKVLKIDVFNFENNLFDDKSVIVECTLEVDNEYIIKAMINNECIDYSFIDIDIAHQVCEALEINFLKLNKFREVKNYDERRDKDIIHVIYSFMIIQNHTKNSISMMIIKLDQHFIILNKS